AGAAAGDTRVACGTRHGDRRLHRRIRPALSRHRGGAGSRDGAAGARPRMNRFLVPLGLFVLLAVVLGIGIRHAPEQGIIASPLLGKPAPEFALPALADPNRTVRSQELRGRWYLLNVWGTWCAECRAEHAMLLRVKQAGLVPLIGLDWKDDAQ